MRLLLTTSRRILRTIAPLAAAVAVPWLICVVEAQSDMQAPLFILFFLAILMGRFFGLMSGLLCAFCAGLSGSYYFLSPSQTWRLDPASAQEAMLFFIATMTSLFILDALQKKSRELRAALDMRDEFLAVAGHELNNPLMALQLRAESELRKLSQSPQENARGVRFVQGQLDTIARLRDLIDELLDMSRIRAGRLQLKPEPVDLTALVREVVVRFADNAKNAGCEVSVEAPDTPVHGVWDRMRIEQVITNLFSNALKYGAGAPVKIVVSASRHDARVQVVDQGCGIAMADQSRIFARFERCQQSGSVKGLGLGLWIVKQILEACGGKVAVRSEAGAGSTFEVCLPLHSRA